MEANTDGISSLEINDVVKILQILSDAADPASTATIAERKRRVLEGLATLVDADVWIWSTGVTQGDEKDRDAMATSMIDGGWKNDQERMLVLGLLTDSNLTPKLQGGVINYLEAGRMVTIGPDKVVHPDHAAEALQIWSQTGLGDGLVSVYPLAKNIFSASGFHRRQGRPNFSPRERAMIHLVFGQVHWLHRYGLAIPAGDKVLDLSPRQRQVLLLLLAGDSPKRIASKMSLSEHTIGDYVKQIYRHFKVTTRGELFAQFITGGHAT